MTAPGCWTCEKGREITRPCARCRIDGACQDIKAAFPTAVSSGAWHVQPFRLTEDDVKWARLRASVNGSYGDVYDLEPGPYVRLVQGNPRPGAIDRTIVMSTTPMERRTCREAVRQARGHVLIGGLGLGMVARAIAASPKVDTVTVLEISEDVLRLVGPSLPATIRVIHGDVMTWAPDQAPKRFSAPGVYDFVWLDIWPEIPNEDDREVMKGLRRRWRKWAPGKGTVQCWREDDTKRRGR